jgi:hypothetical protein
MARAASSSLIPLLVLGAVGYAIFGKAKAAPGAAQSLLPLPLRAGVPYLFVIRLETTDDDAQTVISTKGAENIEFTSASVPPFWAQPGETFSTRAVVFQVTPRGNATLSLGDDFYGIGRLEKLVRLDGQPLSALATEEGF